MLRFSLDSWLKCVFPRSVSRFRSSRRQAIEVLENRCLLTNYLVSSIQDTIDANPGDGVAADVDGQATLRAAVMDANAVAGADTITLGAGFFTLALTGAGEDAAATGDLDIVGDVTIEGAGADQTILDASMLDRFFQVQAGASLTLRNVTIRNGLATNGGAILNRGTLVLDGVDLTGNSTTFRGGAIDNDSGSVTLTSVNVIGNQTRDTSAGGGNSTGGGVSSLGGSLTVQSSYFANNTAAAEGGAITSNGTTLQVTDTSFSNNSANVAGALRVFNGSATLTNVTSTGDHANVFGGFLASNYTAITISNSTFTGNTLAPMPPTGATRLGGVLYLVGLSPSSTTVNVNDSTFTQTGAGDGGAICNVNGRLNLSNSTFDRVTGLRGGAIYNTSSGVLNASNTTFSGGTGTFGGAIYNTAQASVANCTISGNTSNSNSAAVANLSSFAVMNTIFAGNTAGLDVSGAFNSFGGNLIGQVGAATGFTQATDLVGTAANPIDPLLSPLADNGGPVQTMAISSLSPARDGGINSGIFTDARGYPRTGSRIDIGAYEFQNHVPVAGPCNLTTDEDVVLTGVLPAFDADGDALTYELLTPAYGSLIVQPNGQFTYTPPANQSGTDQFRYRVSDGHSTSAAVSGQIVVVPVNDPPTVSDQSYSIIETAPNGSFIGHLVASDIENDSFISEIVSGNDNGAIGLYAPNGSFYVADSSKLDFETNPTLTLVVKLTDNGSPSASSYATITIHVTDGNDAPQPHSETFRVDENSPNGTVVGTIVTDDQDAGQTDTYEIVYSSYEGDFAVNADGQIVVANSFNLNYESLSTRTVIVKVTDSGSPAQSAYATFTINLNDVNDPPTIRDQNFWINENPPEATFIAYLQAYDEDGNQFSGQIISGNEDGAFYFDGMTGALFAVRGDLLDFETRPETSFVVRLTDNGSPSAYRDATITVYLNDVNESPGIQPAAFAIDENSANGTVVGVIMASDVDAGQHLTYSILSGNDSGAFAIDFATGQITVADGALLNYESTASYQLTVQATDDGSPALSSSTTVSIAVNDLNETPLIADQAFSVNENSANGTVVGTVSASDPDAGQSLTYTILSGNTNNAFTIDSATGKITVSNSGTLNFESTPTFALVIRATDNGSPVQSANATVTINLNNVNESPVIGTQAFSVNENSANGTTVGTVSASDPDAGQTLTYAILSGNSNGAFAIDSSTGKITVANTVALNFEATPTFNLMVEVTDNGTPGLSRSATITVNLNNVNEAPVISAQSFSIAENSANGTIIGTPAATDPDAGQTLTWSIISGNTNNAFTVDSTTGRITVANSAALDYETTPTFTLLVRVTDNGTPALSSTATVTISLTDLTEILFVALDVVPGDSTNTIRASKKFELAILSTSTFDARTVDVDSVRFGKLGTEDSGVRTGKNRQLNYSYRDVNGDGLLDLVIQIDSSKTGLKVGDTLAQLTGNLLSGESVAGSSSVIVKK